MRLKQRNPDGPDPRTSMQKNTTALAGLQPGNLSISPPTHHETGGTPHSHSPRYYQTPPTHSGVFEGGGVGPLSGRRSHPRIKNRYRRDCEEASRRPTARAPRAGRGWSSGTLRWRPRTPRRCPPRASQAACCPRGTHPLGAGGSVHSCESNNTNIEKSKTLTTRLPPHCKERMALGEWATGMED